MHSITQIQPYTVQTPIICHISVIFSFIHRSQASAKHDWDKTMALQQNTNQGLRIWAFSLLVLLPAICLAASTKQYQSLTSLKKAAISFSQSQFKQYKASNVEVTIKHLDSRLKLAKCTSPLEVKKKDGANKRFQFHVSISCPQTQHWKIFIPIKVSVFENALTYTRSMQRGEIIQGADIHPKRIDISQLHQGFYNNVNQLVGYKLKHTVGKGQTVQVSQVQKPWDIKKNQTVNISASNPFIDIRMLGKALMNGHKGDLISVQNLNSGKVIQGLVSENGSVKINF